MFSVICDWIILIGAVFGAITAIYKFFLKPYVFLKKKRDDNIEEKESLKKQISDIKDAVNEVKEINLQQSTMIEHMDKSTKDILRQRIMTIFHTYRHTHSMPFHVREELNMLFKDYKAQGGNDYIDKYYDRMNIWETETDDKK